VSARILVIDNDPEMIDVLKRHLGSEGRAVASVTSGAEALATMERHEFDVILTDLVMDGIDGLAVVRETQRVQPRARVILMTAFASLETAIEALRRGAYDYLTKPFKLAEVTVAVDRALEDQRLRDENRRLRQQVERQFSFDNLLGRSEAMRRVFEQIRAVAATDATVLILGESGTGKELVARAIHHNSSRRDGPFVAVNCAAIPENLLESELFGHEKGAFTGADRKRRGLFAEASGGTLFLDEVSELPQPLQPKLLRALQDKAIRPVGANQDVQLDLRVISASNRDLGTLVREGKFRDDLYYRLAVIPTRLPGLRERPEDVTLLATHFLGRAATALGKQLDGFDEEATAWLLQHRWPGNVRELENVVERAATLALGSRVTRADLGIDCALDVAPGIGPRPTLIELQEQYIRRVLEETKGDKAAAARILGISVRTLQRRAE
jgi:DNA-binding NtrC family response regulator